MENLTMKSKQNKTIFTCPHCGAEYVLEEIFYPKSIMGGPTVILRDPLNKIIHVEWTDEAPILEESFTCDFCEKPFIAGFKISPYTLKEEEELDFSKQEVNLFGD